MLRQRSILIRRTWVPGLALALVATGVLIAGGPFTEDPAVAAVSPGVTQRASLADDETEGEEPSGNPSISADGRYVAFDSEYAFDPLDETDDETFPDRDVYLRDTVAGTTTLISHGRTRGGARAPGAGGSRAPSMSADGRYISFATSATNIPAPGSGEASRVVVCDRDPDGDGSFAAECAHTVVSRSRPQGDPQLSADAALSVYASQTGEGPPVLVLVALRRDPSGALLPPEPADVTEVDPPPLGGLWTYRVDEIRDYASSADGSHLGLVVRYAPNNDIVGDRDVVYDYEVASGEFVDMDVDATGTPLPSYAEERGDVALSGDGRRFAFVDLVSGPYPVVRLYDRDPDADGVWYPVEGEPLTAEVGSRNTAGEQVTGILPAFSADGRYFAFVTDAGNVHNGVDDLDVAYNCINQPGPRSYRVRATELPADPHSGTPSASASPSPAARSAGIASAFPLATPSASPGTPSASPGTPSASPPGLLRRSTCDVVVRDLVVDRQRESAGLPRLPAELASPSRLTECAAFVPGATCEGDDDSSGQPVLTANGSALAYGSDATDLVPGDTNGIADVFVRRFTPTMRADPLDFGTVEIGQSAIRTTPVRHVGFGPLTGGPVTVAGPDAGDFEIFPAQDCTGTVLHATEQCAVSVRFRPTVVGVRTGVLRFGPVGVSRPEQVALTGTGKDAPPGFRAAPNPVDFGGRAVLLTSPVRTVTVTNTGRGPLRLGAVTLSGTAPAGFPGDYRITANTCLGAAVPAGGSCQVDVRHVPKAVGVRPAVLRFAQAGDPPTVHGVDLTGAGLAPTIVARPPLATPGQVVRVTGTNFPPGGTVRLSLAGMPGQTRVLVAGTGTLSSQFLILPHTATGRRALRAVTVPPFPTGLVGPVQASTDFLVVPGSLQPPDFTVRK